MATTAAPEGSALAELSAHYDPERTLQAIARDLVEARRLIFGEPRVEVIQRLNVGFTTTYFSRRAAHRLGYEPEELVGVHAHELVAHDAADGPGVGAGHDPDACLALFIERALVAPVRGALLARSGAHVALRGARARRFVRAARAGAYWLQPFWELTYELEGASAELLALPGHDGDQLVEVPAITRTSAAGCFTFTDRTMARIYGYEPEELVGRPLHNLAHGPGDPLATVPHKLADCPTTLPGDELARRCPVRISTRARDGSAVAVTLQGMRPVESRGVFDAPEELRPVWEFVYAIHVSPLMAEMARSDRPLAEWWPSGVATLPVQRLLERVS